MGNPTIPIQPTLLIVDDEPQILELLSHAARNQGFDCVLAKSGNEAFHFIQQRPITAVISDMQMSDGDGKSLLFRIRASGSALPCAFMTAFESREDLQDALRLGSYEFVAKPFSLDLIESLMNRIMALGSSIQREAAHNPILKENALHQAMAYKTLLKPSA